MGIAADSLFNVLMSWVRALVSALWALFSGDRTSVLEFLSKNWMAIAAAIIIGGLVIDWLVWMIRWQPYRLWARRLRRMLRLDEPDEEENTEKGKAHAAVMPEKRYARPTEAQADRKAPLYLNSEDEEDDFFAEDEEWQLLEEARARAEAEQAERIRLEEESRAYEAERARLAREAYEAERARLAQEAYEAEQARLAQQEYERQLEEYERQRVQYERDLAEYERQKAEYEAQLAAQEQAAMTRRRRMPAQSGEDMGATRVQTPVRAQVTSKEQRDSAGRKAASLPEKKSGKKNAEKKNTEKGMERKAEAKSDISSGLLGRMAKMIEPEEEELINRKTLPPRVDMHDAFRTAKLPIVTPPKNGRRKK